MSETLAEQTLAALELETGAMGCISPDRHQKRWLQKVQQLEKRIAMANSTAERMAVAEQLAKLNQVEAKKAKLIVDVYKLNSEAGSAIVKQ
jgi:ABC-type xylose transport system substrate-binding protein